MLEKKKFDYIKLLYWAVIVIVFLIPIFLYLCKFDKPLSNSQDIWGQFGSYISGIYAPIFSFLTLLLLYRQNKSQQEINNYQREFNDATRLRAEADIYLNSLENFLSNGLADTIKNEFSLISANELDGSNYLIVADNIHNKNQKIRSAWISFNIALDSLKVYQNTSFDYHYISLKNIPVIKFGFDCCAGLDNFCYIQTKGKFAFNEYSHIVPKK